MTPGREEGGERQSGKVNAAKNELRDEWRKLIESEERLRFFKKMVGWELEVREIEHLEEDLNHKLKSERMKSARSEKEVIRSIMRLKLTDERRHQRERKQIKNEKREKLTELTSKHHVKKILSMVNGEAQRWRKLERGRYNRKIEHIKSLRVEEEKRLMQICPK